MSDGASLDVSPAELDIIRAILHRHIPDREVWAFGSRVTSRARRYSDLDLCIVGERPVPLSVAAALAEDFSESDLPFKVDLVDWATIGESFRKIISSARLLLSSREAIEMRYLLRHNATTRTR